MLLRHSVAVTDVAYFEEIGRPMAGIKCVQRKGTQRNPKVWKKQKLVARDSWPGDARFGIAGGCKKNCLTG
jgi:hypothetical protein